MSKGSSGRWSAAGLMIAMLATFALVLSCQVGPDGDAPGPELETPGSTASSVVRGETPVIPTTTMNPGPASPTTSPAATSVVPATAGAQPATATALPSLTATVTPSPSPTARQPQPTETPFPSPTLQLAPSCEVGCVKVGVTLESFPGPFSAISDFGTLSGRMPELVQFFQAWGDADAAFKDWLPELSGMGVAPLITWEPWHRADFLEQSRYTLQSILTGEHDAYIDEWAARSAGHDGTIYLRFAHEMNTPPGAVYWYPWQGDPASYVAAWRYVHDRFEAAGATNVEWVWSVAWMNEDAQAYFPGAEYVDWVGLTVLNFGTTVEGPGWRSFAELYTAQDGGVSQSERAASFGKPVMITELASVEQGGDKGQWITELGPALKDQFPEIRAIVWNNYAQARHVPEANWSVGSSESALAGWRTLMSNPYITDPVARMRDTWARTDRPVAEGRISRTWMWGPESFTGELLEPYDESPGGQRTVKYYDKTRMEINDPNGDPSSAFYVTNGLLVVELVEGHYQTGHASFDQSPEPAAVNITGDPGDESGPSPTYADLDRYGLRTAPPHVDGLITQRIDGQGNLSTDPALATHGVTTSEWVQLPGLDHKVASVFYDFLSSEGLIYQFGQFTQARLFEPWYYASGLPITEAYWSRVLVGGQERDLLWQCFERRCLTYTPGNPAGFQVEAGNVGRHYYTWRYG